MAKYLSKILITELEIYYFYKVIKPDPILPPENK